MGRRAVSGRPGGPPTLRELYRARRAWDEAAATTEDPDELDRTWQDFKHAEAKAGFLKGFLVNLTGG